MTEHKPLMPDDPAVGIKYAASFLGWHKVNLLNKLNPTRPEYDAELAQCAYRETEHSPWKFTASMLHAFRGQTIARSRERELKRLSK